MRSWVLSFGKGVLEFGEDERATDPVGTIQIADLDILGLVSDVSNGCVRGSREEAGVRPVAIKSAACKACLSQVSQCLCDGNEASRS
jgi:hypothetical protein